MTIQKKKLIQLSFVNDNGSKIDALFQLWTKCRIFKFLGVLFGVKMAHTWITIRLFIQPVMISIVKGSINSFIRTTGIMLSCQSTYKEQTGREVVNWIVTPARSKAPLWGLLSLTPGKVGVVCHLRRQNMMPLVAAIMCFQASGFTVPLHYSPPPPALPSELRDGRSLFWLFYFHF